MAYATQGNKIWIYGGVGNPDTTYFEVTRAYLFSIFSLHFIINIYLAYLDDIWSLTFGILKIKK